MQGTRLQADYCTVFRPSTPHGRKSSPDEKELERLGFITGASDLNQILSTLKTRLSQYGVAGSIVIDEVQDMTPAEALLITLLCDFDEADAHRVMLAGDEFQTLNGNDFSWGTWVTGHTIWQNPP